MSRLLGICKPRPFSWISWVANGPHCAAAKAGQQMANSRGSGDGKRTISKSLHLFQVCLTRAIAIFSPNLGKTYFLQVLSQDVPYRHAVKPR